MEELLAGGYRPSTVADTEVSPGERVPAFFIGGQTAYFGWVFWEKFTPRRSRKLWGSEVRNRRGDWEIQIPASGREVIYVNNSLKREMDIDRPSGI